MDPKFISIIQQVIYDRGKTVVNNLAVFNSLLADYARGEFVRERKHFIWELESNSFDKVMNKYQSPPPKPAPATRPPAVQPRPAPQPPENRSVPSNYADDDEDYLDDDDEDDFDDLDDFDDDEEGGEDDDVVWECNGCSKIFDWKPVMYSYKGTVGYFCSDKCGREAVKRMKEYDAKTIDNAINLGINIFKAFFD